SARRQRSDGELPGCVPALRQRPTGPITQFNIKWCFQVPYYYCQVLSYAFFIYFIHSYIKL
ncbi:hypothetical protein L9F63_024691, partial [Diploptera punctata]